ncbi:histone acetyltransferase, ELP3 family [Archaeoglobus sulfaticallidus PM70-1]|uniref:tRNA carboxymethyluridine synthase n=1 Tax=Archaeoglobus sulfaticallidus PM70-1 TaxID=387631 RepID=N0BB50_9EURY|nr:tRNA uridine(34) 5-carboxymethylaminomethyl modification radical SAM/GNAT enzyme Elp3 [Archaeoglobus sulfaticallidus]AGK60228.1 histone acetyltransferase, ELP3 family [Archaeoglobus sulfaticallidus PM70-1]
MDAHSTYHKACKEIAEELIKASTEPGIELTRSDIEIIKKRIAKKYNLSRIPSNPDIRKFIPDNERIKKMLRIKPVRTISGVAVVAVMSSPAPCPHGRCVPCPGGIKTPQSYTGREPAAMRAIQHGYDPFRQVTARLGELKEIGHAVDKVEIIVMGGTFPARDKEYRDHFILNIYNALNSFDSDPSISSTIEEAKEINEKAKARCIGMTFETRPDYCGLGEIKEMLSYGGTKVELGVQSIYDDVLEIIKRGHGVDATVKATKLLKNSAFKVGYHIMPGLPSSDFERDLRMFRKIFEDERFKPDYLKIYPTLVVDGTELYEMYRSGEYRPYTTEEVAELIARAKRFFPKWVRVQRIQRDIPVKLAIGLDKGNLRQIVHQKLKERGWRCNCIRCREIGHNVGESRVEEILSSCELKIERYRASDGVEYFISYETEDFLAGFIRLRFCEAALEEIENHALIRELHVYGISLPLGLKDSSSPQHRGIGSKLLSAAEEIAIQEFDRIAVISGVGAREYYRKHGYKKLRNYMAKRLK